VSNSSPSNRTPAVSNVGTDLAEVDNRLIALAKQI
jgi:hypothetical protein